MIVLDANLLLYAYDASSAIHAQARAWIESVLSDGTPVGLPWQTVGDLYTHRDESAASG